MNEEEQCPSILHAKVIHLREKYERENRKARFYKKIISTHLPLSYVDQIDDYMLENNNYCMDDLESHKISDLMQVCISHSRKLAELRKTDVSKGV